MRTCIPLVFICALAVSGEAQQEKPVALRDKVLQLVEQLSNDEFSIREKAQAELIALGKDGFAIIRTLPKSTDAETNLRLKNIQLQFQVDEVTSLDQALELRRKFLDSNNKDLAAATMKKAESFAKPIEIAQALYKSALADYRATKARMAERSATLDQRFRRIAQDLEDSVNYFDAHVKSHPEDKEAEQREQEAAMILYSCRKYLTL